MFRNPSSTHSLYVDRLVHDVSRRFALAATAIGIRAVSDIYKGVWDHTRPIAAKYTAILNEQDKAYKKSNPYYRKTLRNGLPCKFGK